MRESRKKSMDIRPIIKKERNTVSMKASEEREPERARVCDIV